MLLMYLKNNQYAFKEYPELKEELTLRINYGKMVRLIMKECQIMKSRFL